MFSMKKEPNSRFSYESSNPNILTNQMAHNAKDFQIFAECAKTNSSETFGKPFTNFSTVDKNENFYRA
jgi:hypothetical protein